MTGPGARRPWLVRRRRVGRRREPRVDHYSCWGGEGQKGGLLDQGKIRRTSREESARVKWRGNRNATQVQPSAGCGSLARSKVSLIATAGRTTFGDWTIGTDACTFLNTSLRGRRSAFARSSADVMPGAALSQSQEKTSAARARSGAEILAGATLSQSMRKLRGRHSTFGRFD